MSSNHIIVQTTFDNPADAAAMSDVFRSRFAATDIKLTDVQSIFWWEGNIDTVTEQVLVMHISANNYQAVENYISQNHKYKTPCIIAFDDAPTQNGTDSDWPTDYCLAQTMIGDRETARLLGDDLVQRCMAACTKTWPTAGDTSKGAPYWLSIETTRVRLDEISALALPGVSVMSVKPIVMGVVKFLDWIGESVAGRPENGLASVLSNGRDVPAFAAVTPAIGPE